MTLINKRAYVHSIKSAAEYLEQCDLHQLDEGLLQSADHTVHGVLNHLFNTHGPEADPRYRQPSQPQDS